MNRRVKMNIISIKRHNYSWIYDEEKRNKNDSSFTMEASLEPTHKVLDYDEEQRIETLIDFKLEIIQEGISIGTYNEIHKLVTQSDINVNELNKKEKFKFDNDVVSIIEPYIRFNLERTLIDSSFPRYILPYRFWENAMYLEDEN